MERFAWEAPELLQDDVVVGEIDEDEFAEALAAFLWQYW